MKTFASRLLQLALGAAALSTSLLASSTSRADEPGPPIVLRALPGDAPETHLRSPTMLGVGIGLGVVGGTSVALGVVELSSQGSGCRTIGGVPRCTGVGDPLAGLGLNLIVVGASQVIGGATMAILGGTSVKERASIVPTASIGPRAMSLRWVF